MTNSEDEIMIQLSTKRVKLSECENEDRLSDLPESVILHLLSFLNTKHAVQTCVLSTRWKNLWTRIPALKLSPFGNYKKFTKLVYRVLSLRDSSITLQALDLVRIAGRLEPHLLKMIVNYAISHNVKRLSLSVTSDIAQIPPTLFSSQNLTYLNLSISTGDITQIPLNLPALTYLELHIYFGHRPNLFPKSLNLPSLTSLKLGNFTFCVGDNECAEPFSTFNKLNSLFISGCTVTGTQTLCISSATLVNFTMCNYSDEFYIIELCTPSLCTFAFTGIPNQKLSGSNVSSLKHVDIAAKVYSYGDTRPFLLFSWLLELANIKSLIVSATTLQVLSLIDGLLKVDFPSLGNLKSLKVIIKEISYDVRMALCEAKLRDVKSKKVAARIRKAFRLGLEPSSPIPDGIVAFLLQNSPSAKVDFINRSIQPHRTRDL